MNATAAINIYAIPFSERRTGALISVVLNNNNMLAANKARPENSRFSVILTRIKIVYFKGR